MRTGSQICLTILVGLTLAAAPARAILSSNTFVALTEENDLLSNPFGGHSDRHYTQGLRLTMMLGDESFTNVSVRLNRWCPPLGFTPRANSLGLVLLAQHMFTPEDIVNPAPIPTDRPYAAWLYSGFIWQREGLTAGTIPTLENFEADLGSIGPSALGEQAQNLIHRWAFPDDIARGWNNQLHDEPALQLRYARLWRFTPEPPGPRRLDLIPHLGAGLGNVKIEANLGATARLGYRLPDDFGVPIMDAPLAVNGWTPHGYPPFFCYLFGRIEGRAVAHNIFLDGNTWRDSPHVTRNPWVADFSWGFALNIRRHFELAYTRIIRTTEFTGQKGADEFGSLTLRVTLSY